MSLVEAIDSPFPLRRKFLRQILPGLVIFICLLIVLTAVAGNRVMRTFYLELAQNRGNAIVQLTRQSEPETWAALLKVADPETVLQTSAGKALERVLKIATSAHEINRIKLYNPDRIVVFSFRPVDIGDEETNQTMMAAAQQLEPGLIKKNYGDAQFYEFYVPIVDEAGNLETVIELYEPTGLLDAVLWRYATTTVVVPTALLVLLAMILARLVYRAQYDINKRTMAILSMRGQLEKLVSEKAVSASRQAAQGNAMNSQIIRCTLIYTDVRDFTSFAETVKPAEVVAFLNHIMEIQVTAIQAYGGDIDKMIGDALFARFEGDDRQDRAILAARQIHYELGRHDLPRGVGIGIHDGPVLAGLVGPASRQDFTVIGDSVNIAARLCSAAGKGELVVDIETLEATTDQTLFGKKETIFVKGRHASITIRRWNP